MGVVFEDLMFVFFIVADVVSLISACRAKKGFSLLVKLRAIMFTVGFLVGIIWQVACDNLLGIISCIVGFMLSQFVAALTFYQNYKDMEIPYE